MTEPGLCGRRVVDDDDELDRLLSRLELPDVAPDVPGGKVPPRLDDLDWEWGE